MASASRLTYPVLVESLHPGHRGGVLAPLSGVAGSLNHRASPQDRVANGQDAIDTWIEPANHLGDLGHALPRPPWRPVLGAAR